MQPVKFYAIGQDQTDKFTVQWNLGNTCNWKCDYCPAMLHDGSINWADNSLVKKVLLDIKNKFPEKKIHVEFLGGEVTLKSDFIELVQFCKEQNFSTLIVSNASRTIRYWEELTPFLDCAVLTFHPAISKKKHYETVISTFLKNNSTPICSLAMVKNNFDELVAYKNYLEEKFENKVRVDFAILYDKENKLSYNGYFYDYEPHQLEIFKSHGGKSYVIEYDNGHKQELSLGEVYDMKLNDFSGYICGSSLSMLSIDFFGRASISVCPQRPFTNIKNTNIIDLLTPRVCEQNECRNPSDLRIFKIKK